MTTLKPLRTVCIAVFLSLIAFTGKAQVHAEFIATPTAGCSPVVVNFTDQSTGNPTQWKWDLGNGTISFLQNPSATYFTPGQYNIKLVVQNAAGADSIVKLQYINIYPQPVVEFSASQQSGCFPLPIQFTDLSTTSSGAISQWQWDFGDGTFGNTQNPQHTYSAAGNYNVSLVVTTSHGCFKALTKPQFIQIANGVSANFSNSVPNSCTAPVNINFQNLTVGTGVLTYAWNFGDGATSNLQTPSHIYTSSGSYTVQLIVTNSTGCRDTIIKPNAVSVGNTLTSFTTRDSTCVSTNITLTNTSTPVPASAFWDFGDGTTATTVNATKFYNTAGTYQIKLINNFGACVDSLTKTIVVSPLPTANFLAVDTLSCSAPFTVNFTNTSSGATSYTWLFGDGGTSNLVHPTHTYNAPGSYTVKLIATNNFGCSNSITKQNYIRIELPQATINNLPQRGCAPFEWTFASTVNSSEPVTGYNWNFGDGTTSTLENPTHIFGPGNFTITLIITTANGCTDTVKVINGIKTGLKPEANFTATPLEACAYIPVNFTDLTPAPVDQWLWDFGDGLSSAMHNPVHVYGDTGLFTVQLIVWNNGCPDTIKFADYVHINPPIANYIVTRNCTEPLKRVFTDHSIGADSWAWDFGDGTTSSLVNPVHVYATPGTYNVSLVVTNFLTGCTYTQTSTENIIIEHANFTASDTTICNRTNVMFTAIGSNAINIASYNWTFGDGSIGSGLTPFHTYINTGLYDVRLIITDKNGCKDTLVKQQYITVNGPHANFGVSISATCLLSAINFTDSSTTDGTHSIVQWVWNYGDGIRDTLTSASSSHTYASAGIYTVTLTVMDNSGCSDSLVKTSLVTISKPVANFLSDTLSCPGRDIIFTNTSTGPGLTYTWYFGDGATSVLANPTHSYAADGVYTIKLVIYDQYGCTDSIIKSDYVAINTPVANFNVSDTLGTCPPLIVNFTNTSQNYISLSWDFGDGTSTTNPNPSHFYNIPGTYYAMLTVRGQGGCISSKQQKIVVRGPYGTFTYGALAGCKPLTVNFSATTHDRISFVWDFNDGNTLQTSDSIVSHTYNTIGSYVPKMILIDASGCTVAIRGLDTIRIHGVNPEFTFTPPVLCNSGTAQFNNTTTGSDPITGYEWNFGDGSTSTQANPAHFYSAPGLYYPSLKVRTAYGCSDSITSILPVKIVATPKAQITKTADGCTPITVTFNGSLVVADTSALSWSWNFGNGNTSLLTNPPAQLYNIAGTHPVTLFVTNSMGCVDTVVSSVHAFAIPNVNAGADTLICKGTGRTLTATGAATYVWTPATGLSCTTCASPVALPDNVITYTVTGTSSDGCVKSDDIVVRVKYPFTMSNSIGDTLCKGSSVSLFAAGAYTYSWSPATGLNSATSATPKATPLVTTNYRVIGTDDKNCFSDTAYVPITVYNIPTVEAGADKTINVGQSLDLIPVISSDVTKVLWTPTGSIFRSTFPTVSIKPRETTTYIVTVENQGRCTARDNVTVYVLCNGANVFIPNTFSPNGDGANDVFYPRGTGLFSIKTARIFNRWGEVVYEKAEFQPNDASAGWDGTYKGKKLNADVFIYTIEILCDNNTTLTYKGNIALIN